MSGQPFAAIRRGNANPEITKKFAKRVKADTFPYMPKMKGFNGHYLVVDANDTIIAVIHLTDKEATQTSTETLMWWIKENLRPLLASLMEATDGTVVESA
jgi:hypothetical protein